MIINMNGAKAPETPSSVLQEKTVTPETLPTVIGPDEGYDGLTQVTVNPDSQLKAENIRSGKTIFGVAGSFVGEPVYTTTDFVNFWRLQGIFPVSSIYPGGYASSGNSWTLTGGGETRRVSPLNTGNRGIGTITNNNVSALNIAPAGGYRNEYGFEYTVHTNGISFSGVSVDVYGYSPSTFSIAAGTPVNISFKGIIYPYTTKSVELGPAEKGGYVPFEYNGTGTVKYDVSVSDNPSYKNVVLTLDTPLTIDACDMTYYASVSSDTVVSYGNIGLYFYDLYAEW